MQFSDKLKLARQQHQYTQTQVAEQLHVSSKTISSWENARSFPDIGTLVRISDLYDISLDRLLREDQTMMDHYEAIDKHALRDKRIFQVTTIISLTFLNQPTTIPTDVSSSAYSAQAVQGYLAGAKIGIAMRIILGTLSTIFIVFGSEDILDKN